jgi:nucleoside-diphosphate-sugar epimerase
MKTVLFGAAGYLGRAILANLESGDSPHAVRAFDRSPEAWAAWEDVDGAWAGEKIYGDTSDYDTVLAATQGVDAIVHASVYFGQEPEDPLPWLVNLKGLWNVLEAARQRGIRRVVHISSCESVHADGKFLSAEQRGPGKGLYPLTKRLQEEMCRSFWDAHRVPVIVLRPDCIVDARTGVGRFREQLGVNAFTRNGWVCRHDLAQACRLALAAQASGQLQFDIFHIVGTPEADATCNVARSREVLGLEYQGNLEQYRSEQG